MGRGKFIVLEGVDGAGTTTQARLIHQALSERGVKTALTAQPSVGPIGKLLRSILRGELTREDREPIGTRAIAALFAADRSEHIENCIEPYLSAGYHVVCDRYYHSSLAYQGLELGLDYVAALNEPMLTPDRIFFLDVMPDVASARRTQRHLAEELYEVAAVQNRLRDAYAAAFKLRDQERTVTLDGSAEIQSIHRQLMEGVDALIT